MSDKEHNALSNDDFRALIAGKRCIVLAPSAWLRDQGEVARQIIGSYDLIVKTTNMCELDDPQNILGQRCDIWYGLPGASDGWQLSLQSLVEQQVRLMRIQPCLAVYRAKWQQYMRTFDLCRKGFHIPFSIADKTVYADLQQQVDCTPLSGVFAITDLLAHGAAEVCAYGHDFYRSGYFTGRTTIRAMTDDAWHKLEPQMCYLWQLLLHEPRFNCDDNLRSLLTETFASEPQKSALRKQFLAEQLGNISFAGPTLLFRSCNLVEFSQLLESLECRLELASCDLVCQSDVAGQFLSSRCNILRYEKPGPFDAEYLIQQNCFKVGHYQRCLLPYNGSSMLNYYQLITLAVQLEIPEIYFISPRGAVKRLPDPESALKSMNWYQHNKDKFLSAMTTYDKAAFF